MKEDMNPREGMPELGTREAAFKACVSMIAHLCGHPVETVQYWLDLYYFVRRAYEQENGWISITRCAWPGRWKRTGSGGKTGGSSTGYR